VCAHKLYVPDNIGFCGFLTRIRPFLKNLFFYPYEYKKHQDQRHPPTGRGVSVGTVDRVYTTGGRVSEEALKKVLTVLDQIDYKPNLIVRMLGANKTYRIVTLMPNPEQDPYWASLKSGISQAEAEWLRYGVSVGPHFPKLARVFQKGLRDGVTWYVAGTFFTPSMRSSKM
jgi:hypothetical protein